MPHSKGFRRKSRGLQKYSHHAHGLSNIMTQYAVNDEVVIDIDSSQVKGMPHRRFQGKVGVVTEIRPRSLVIKLPIGDKMKTITPRLEHVKLHKGSAASVEKTSAAEAKTEKTKANAPKAKVASNPKTAAKPKATKAKAPTGSKE
ncbi:MAG: hypothetical protein M1503_08130 [Thaumarchaeota archaeon]|nr:hypothetical protein [Nitrososphaerota archaeon]MCL5318208.1 hypothetical protein [Nitrososphaerota archaeon]